MVALFSVLGPRDEFDALLLLQIIIIMLVGLFALVVAACRRLRHCRLLMVLVKEVTFEHCLGCYSLQMNLIFLHSILILPFLIVHMILIKIVVLWGR